MSAEGAATPSRATLAEVAELANVSISTVSKVLNGRPGVSSDTRASIEALLHSRQYNRRNSAQSTAELIEVLLYEINSPFGSEALARLEAVTRSQGIGLVVSGTDERRVAEPGWVDAMLRRHPIGVILIASALHARDRQKLRARGIPVVAIDPSGEPDPDTPTIGSADWNGGFQAAKHLVDLGHRDIAIITGPDDMLASTARLSGYRAALEAAGVPIRPEYIRPGRFHHDDGLSQGLELLRMPHRPTAIFASSDLQALGVYEAAHITGVGIPDELSVVGYDDLAISRWVGPPLTTVRVPLAQMVEQAARLIARLRDEPGLVFGKIDVATSLIARKSSSTPRD